MAELVKLTPGQSPPEGGDFVLIKRDPRFANTVHFHGKGATFFIAGDEDLSDAIDMACDHAAPHDLNIYIQMGSD